MKKAVLFLLMLSYFSAFSQTARINGQDCPSATSCFSNVCYGQTFDLEASLSPGFTVDSVVWFERIIDGNTGLAYNSYSQVGGGALTISAPFSSLPVGNYYYRYWLVVYFSGGIETAYINLNMVDPPDALLSASSSTICAGETVFFTASGGSSYEFRVNGSIVQDSTNNQFSSNSLNNNDTVVVMVTENGCSAMSSPIIMTVHDLPTVTSVTGNTVPACVGDPASVEIIGLTDNGPWNLEVYNDASGSPSTLYFDVGSVSSSDVTILVPIGSEGFETKHLRITDSNGCSNF